MYTFEAKGNFQTNVNFLETMHIIFPNQIELIFPEPLTEESVKNFLIKGKTENVESLKTFIDKIIRSTTQWISLIYDTSVHSASISDLTYKDEQDRQGITVFVKSLHLPCSYEISIGDKKTQLFREELIRNIDKNIFVIELFSQALNEISLYSKFWYFYNILQITIGERGDIDDYIKRNFPDVPVFNNIKTKQRNSVFITIRDDFNHPIRIENDFNRDEEISKNIHNLQAIAKGTIKNYLNLPREI